MTRDEQAYTLALIELCRRRPETQDDCCALAARVDVAMYGIPQSDDEYLDRAIGIARGLFGPAFRAATGHQKRAWIDMCERALRDEAEPA